MQWRQRQTRAFPFLFDSTILKGSRIWIPNIFNKAKWRPMVILRLLMKQTKR
jgi:hypothetical protein